MKIVVGKPPIYDRAATVFPLSGREVFAFGDTIYNPDGMFIPEWIVDHEKVHGLQQSGFESPDAWWDLYLIDAQFRYTQELAAHREEYRSYCRHNKDRNARARYLDLVARKLAAPLYGSVVSFPEAKKEIKK